VVKVRARTVVQGRVRVRVRVGAKVRAAQQRMWCAGEGRRALTGTTLDSAAMSQSWHSCMDLKYPSVNLSSLRSV
jgi:hypothetical protein